MLLNKILLFAVLAVVITALDLWSKSYVFSELPVQGQSISVIDGVFEIVHHTNPGGMWGVGGDWNPWILRIVRLAAVLVIFVILVQTPSRDRTAVAALGMVMGAVGNIHDSLRFLEVRDFLKFDFGFHPFHPFPTFNVADSAICVGVALLALQMLFAARAEKSKETADSGGA